MRASMQEYHVPHFARGGTVSYPVEQRIFIVGPIYFETQAPLLQIHWE